MSIGGAAPVCTHPTLGGGRGGEGQRNGAGRSACPRAGCRTPPNCWVCRGRWTRMRTVRGICVRTLQTRTLAALKHSVHARASSLLCICLYSCFKRPGQAVGTCGTRKQPKHLRAWTGWVATGGRGMAADADGWVGSGGRVGSGWCAWVGGGRAGDRWCGWVGGWVVVPVRLWGSKEGDRRIKILSPWT